MLPNWKICYRRTTWYTGLTGRKIIIDTYGGKGAHGGGAFSGKDPSKVDRSMPHTLQGILQKILLQLDYVKKNSCVSYAIGIAEPMGIFVDTYGTSKKNISDGDIARIIEKMPCFNLKPASIIKRLKLTQPMYSETAAYGHMGRNSVKKTVTFNVNGAKKNIDIETFTWEKLDCIDEVKLAFNL